MLNIFGYPPNVCLDYSAFLLLNNFTNIRKFFQTSKLFVIIIIEMLYILWASYLQLVYYPTIIIFFKMILVISGFLPYRVGHIVGFITIGFNHYLILLLQIYESFFKLPNLFVNIFLVAADGFEPSTFRL